MDITRRECIRRICGALALPPALLGARAAEGVELELVLMSEAAEELYRGRFPVRSVEDLYTFQWENHGDGVVLVRGVWGRVRNPNVEALRERYGARATELLRELWETWRFVPFKNTSGMRLEPGDSVTVQIPLYAFVLDLP